MYKVYYYTERRRLSDHVYVELFAVNMNGIATRRCEDNERAQRLILHVTAICKAAQL